MSGIQAVVFDIGNVLLEWDPIRVYDAAIGAERRRALFAEVDLEGMNEEIDLGADFKETVFAKAEEHPDWANEIRLWYTRWMDMASPAIARTVRVKDALRAKGVPVFALSNFGIATFELAEKHYPFLSSFDQRFISGYLRMSKPDPRIYEALERGTGITSSALLFTDDRPENIATARARGWHCHLFDGAAGFAERLVAEELLTETEAV